MANPEVTRIGGKWRIVADRRELASRRPAWTVEGPDGSTDLCWSRSAAIVAGRRRWTDLDAALSAAGL
jgi:hypothetical protein